MTYVEQVLKKLKDINYGSLATVVGRYYAMDRDKRWERIQIAYEALVQGKGEETTPDKVIEVKTDSWLIRLCKVYHRLKDPLLKHAIPSPAVYKLSLFILCLSLLFFSFFFSFKVIKGRYEAEGDKRETDEFLKPIIVDPEGRIRGLCWVFKTDEKATEY